VEVGGKVKGAGKGKKKNDRKKNKPPIAGVKREREEDGDADNTGRDEDGASTPPITPVRSRSSWRSQQLPMRGHTSYISIAIMPPVDEKEQITKKD
jgi:hypothetical protein